MTPTATRAAPPTCPACGAKFPGNPCNKCARTPAQASVAAEQFAEEHATRMPSATRRRNKHGRSGVKR